MSLPPPSSKKCYNSECSNLKPERTRKGWRLRSGEFSELCDRCASVYEQGRFCETFHANASGWRNCETCGKRVHCGCVVSSNVFALLDPGGIECINCARKNVILAPNSAWQPSFFLPVKNWSQLAGSGPVPWRQAPVLFNSSVGTSDLHSKGSCDAELSVGIDRLNIGERLPASSLERKKVEDFTLRRGTHELYENGNGGINSGGNSSSSLDKSQQLSAVKESDFKAQFGFPAPYSSKNEANGHVGAFSSHLKSTPSPPFVKQLHCTSQNGLESSGDTQIRNCRPRMDIRGRNQPLPRYWPRITDQELREISGGSNITPLFEKMLSASDAGKIGRLVLPKKCAEAYLPPISHPEGLPLKVLDTKGKEWTFQFRFWPNNNSRMYVLEGITPCIQTMQLQAGDIVTFSRDPEGRLVMGCRKASGPPSDQGDTVKIGNGASIRKDADMVDPKSWSKVDKSGYMANEAVGAKALISRKKKSSTMGSKSKRLRIDSEDVIEMKLSWEEAQGLLRPPPNDAPSVVVIEGFEFEEYKDAPILGKPTIFAADDSGEKVQWAQCEDCRQWRKLPANALLPSHWTCSDNLWNPERSSCSAAQELTEEQLEDLLRDKDLAASKKMKAAKQSADSEALKGLDTLANLAILGEGDGLPASAQATTKHPRHRPGCSCIVCIQPPSGKGPKHRQSCICNVCQSVKRRFRTLMLRREKKQSMKEVETPRKRQQQQTEKSGEDNPGSCNNVGNSFSNQRRNLISDGCDDASATKSSESPFKGQIDLNIQPEREEELSPSSVSGNMTKTPNNATEGYLKQLGASNMAIDRTSASDQMDSNGNGFGEKPSNDVSHSSSHQVVEDHNATSSTKQPASPSNVG